MADRSLSFFATLANKQNNPDNNTGMSTSNKEVQYDIKKYNQNDPLSAPAAENKTVNYTVVNSLQNEDQYINYLGNSNINEFTKYINNPEHESDIKLSSIIEWTQKNHPAMKLNAFNFAYLKDFGVYPANRLMILRRFNGPVPDNIFNTLSKPTNTLVTYYDLENSPLTISFNEEWEKSDEQFIEVLEDVIGIKLSSAIDMAGNIPLLGSNLAQDVLNKIGQKLGIISEGGMPYGDPNIIYEATRRKVEGDKVVSGLTSKINIEFETTYVMREIHGIDAKAAMLDIISNVINMGTSNSRFLITGSAAAGLQKLMKDMENGDTAGLIKNIIDGITELINKAVESISQVGGAIIDDPDPAGALSAAFASLTNDLLKQRYTRYKWKMVGVVGALSGNYTAPWHITIGNPKFPWFTCGNLVVKDVTLNVGGELGYNDMFTELNVKIKLESGRSLGAQELASLFNSGNGRIYDTPDKVQLLYVPADSNVIIPGNTTDTTETSTLDQSNNPIDEEQENKLDNSSDFAINNVDEDDSTIEEPGIDKQNAESQKDENLPTTKNDSNKGYKYTVIKQGPKKWVEVYDETGENIHTGYPSSTLTEAYLIQEAKTDVGDV